MDKREAAATLNVSLPESMREFIVERVNTGGFSSASEFVRMLIREYQTKLEKERIDALLIEGIESGPAKPYSPSSWKRRTAQLASRARARTKRKGQP